MELVLAGQHGFDRRARPARSFRHECGTEGAELFMIADDAPRARKPGTQGSQAAEALHVEPCQACVARETE